MRPRDPRQREAEPVHRQALALFDRRRLARGGNDDFVAARGQLDAEALDVGPEATALGGVGVADLEHPHA